MESTWPDTIIIAPKSVGTNVVNELLCNDPSTPVSSSLPDLDKSTLTGVSTRGLKRAVSVESDEVDKKKPKLESDDKPPTDDDSNHDVSYLAKPVVEFMPSQNEKVSNETKPERHHCPILRKQFLTNALDEVAQFSSLLDRIKMDHWMRGERAISPPASSAIAPPRESFSADGYLPHRFERRNSFVVQRKHSTSMGLRNAVTTQRPAAFSATLNRSNQTGPNLMDDMRNETLSSSSKSSKSQDQDRQYAATLTLGSYSKEDILRRINALRYKTKL